MSVVVRGPLEGHRYEVWLHAEEPPEGKDVHMVHFQEDLDDLLREHGLQDEQVDLEVSQPMPNHPGAETAA